MTYEGGEGFLAEGSLAERNKRVQEAGKVHMVSIEAVNTTARQNWEEARATIREAKQMVSDQVKNLEEQREAAGWMKKPGNEPAEGSSGQGSPQSQPPREERQEEVSNEDRTPERSPGSANRDDHL